SPGTACGHRRYRRTRPGRVALGGIQIGRGPLGWRRRTLLLNDQRTITASPTKAEIMKIKHVHIDGFGVWHDLKLDDLSPKLTAFYGANEAGKTTLMQFLRSVLYG